MSLLQPPPELVQYGLRAMKVVATADGRFDERERAVLEAARDALGSTVDLDELVPIHPAELAAMIPAEALRKQLIGGLIVVALADEVASLAEVEVIEQFATALGVESPYVKNLRRLAEGHTLIMRLRVACG
jgi:tellurite resistance protein